MKQKKYSIELQNVATVYEGEKTPAIYDIDLQVPYREFLSIIGPNGAGKTTLLETINGLLPYTAGSGHVFGKKINRHATQVRKNIGYVIQNFDIDPLAPFLCKDIVMSGRSGKIGLFRFARKSDWEKVWYALSLVGMIDFAYRPVGKLSGGEFQKVLLARALSQEPDLLLLDEPFSNLDLAARENMERLLSKIYHEKQMTIVLVSHDLSLIPQECSRVVLLDKGRIIMDGNREEILTSDTVQAVFHKEGTQV